MTKRLAIYARISVSSDESVSVARQIDAAQKYADAQGWLVVATFTDEGVSATHNKPENRPGWRALLDSSEQFEGVLVWKVDRLARKVMDFLNADESLQSRGAAVVCVTQPIDMTTPEGRLFVTILAAFAEMEAAAISARVKAARSYLLRAGRVVGGGVPYGWQSVPNPDGGGLVLAQDPELIAWVAGMASRVVGGATIYGVMKWLDAEGAPLPTRSQVNRRRTGWHYSTVERLLRHPIMAGMTPFNPGNASKERGTEVLRDENGLPVVDESIAILSSEEHRKLVALLDSRDAGQTQPRSSKATTSPFLSRLVWCGHCDRLMHRGINQGRPVLNCASVSSGCGQTISRRQLDPYLIDRLLTERGSLDIIKATEVIEDNSTELADIEAAILNVTQQLTQDDTDDNALIEQLGTLKGLRSKARERKPAHRHWKITGRTVRMAWDACSDDLERREVLAGQIDTLRILRGRVGRYLDPARVSIQWRTDPFDEAEDQADNAERWPWPTDQNA